MTSLRAMSEKFHAIKSGFSPFKNSASHIMVWLFLHSSPHSLELLVPNKPRNRQRRIKNQALNLKTNFHSSPTGACGFGDYGRIVNDGSMSGVSRLYRNGTGCGGCYQVWCKIPQLCTEDGARVVVTDYGEGDKTDFILSTRAYARLARPNVASELFAYGVVDIEYRRISCQYPSYNLMVKVHENSRFPDYLAIIILYQAGQNDITAVEVWQVDCQQWRGLRNAYGAVWDMSSPPTGALNFRVQVTGRSGLKWVQLSSVLPSEWKAGAAYETTVQLT